MTLTRHDKASWLKTVWNALDYYRDCHPEGTPEDDKDWDDICTAMAWITEELEIPDDTRRPD